MSKRARDFGGETSIIWDILRRKYEMKTVNITVSLFLDMVLEIEQYMRKRDINSRSMAVAFLIMQGLTRVQEIDAEAWVEPEEKKGKLSEDEKEEMKALDHVYDVEE